MEFKVYIYNVRFGSTYIIKLFFSFMSVPYLATVHHVGDMYGTVYSVLHISTPGVNK
jgi:hypothetical protein